MYNCHVVGDTDAVSWKASAVRVGANWCSVKGFKSRGFCRLRSGPNGGTHNEKVRWAIPRG